VLRFPLRAFASSSAFSAVKCFLNLKRLATKLPEVAEVRRGWHFQHHALHHKVSETSSQFLSYNPHVALPYSSDQAKTV